MELGPEDFRELSPPEAAQFNELIDRFIADHPGEDAFVMEQMIKEDLSIADIEEQFGIPEREVLAIWSRAMKALRKAEISGEG